jgi:hypothetical protein
MHQRLASANIRTCMGNLPTLWRRRRHESVGGIFVAIVALSGDTCMRGSESVLMRASKHAVDVACGSQTCGRQRSGIEAGG